MWIGIIAVVAVIAFIMAFIIPKSPGGGNYSITNNTVTIESASVGKLGDALVTDKGYALYIFLPDTQNAVTCYDRCALHWPPIFLPGETRVVAGEGVDGSLLGVMTDRNGKRVATYSGWPLYLYQGDVRPGPATGHGQYLDGGYWYIIRPDGHVVTPSPQQ